MRNCELPFVSYNTWLMIASMLINKRCKWQIFILDLNTGFGLSPVEAEALCYALKSHGLTRITTKVLEDQVRKRKQLPLEENKRASPYILYCRAKRRNNGLRLCDEPIEQGGVRNCSKSCGVRAIDCKMQSAKCKI